MRKPCGHPGCPELTHSRYCEKHTKANAVCYERDRGSSHARGYGAAWRKLREHILRRDPVCQAEGCEKPATDVDHIVTRRRGCTDDPNNLQSL